MIDTFTRWWNNFKTGAESQSPNDLPAAANLHFRQHICWEIDLLKARLARLEGRDDEA